MSLMQRTDACQRGRFPGTPVDQLCDTCWLKGTDLSNAATLPSKEQLEHILAVNPKAQRDLRLYLNLMINGLRFLWRNRDLGSCGAGAAWPSPFVVMCMKLEARLSRWDQKLSTAQRVMLYDFDERARTMVH